MNNLKTFYGSTVIDNNDSEEINAGEIELEYYKTKSNLERRNLELYGIGIIKKRKSEKTLEIEEKEVTNIKLKEKDVDNILNLLMAYKVTPTGLDDVLEDLVNY